MPNLKALRQLSLFLILSLLANSSQALEIAVHEMHGHGEVSMLAAAQGGLDSHNGHNDRQNDRQNENHRLDKPLPHPGVEASHSDQARFKSTGHSAASLTVYPTDSSADFSPGSADDCLCAELCCMSLAGFSFAATGQSHYPGISFDKRLPDHYQSISLDPLLPPPDH